LRLAKLLRKTDRAGEAEPLEARAKGIRARSTASSSAPVPPAAPATSSQPK